MTDDREARIRAAVDTTLDCLKKECVPRSWAYISSPGSHKFSVEFAPVHILADAFRDFLTEAEERGKWVECPECHGSELEGCGHDCGTCKDGTGRIRRELKGALWAAGLPLVPDDVRAMQEEEAREKWGER